jgi:hypothetical protein
MKRNLLIAKILLTIGTLEFFAPIFKDTGPSHLMNSEWVGHAKVHMAWLLGYMFFSGLANMYFIWIRKPFHINHLYLSCLWQATHLAGFWAGIAFVPLYGGAIVDARYHTHVLGIDENIFAFMVFTAILLAAYFWIRVKVAPSYNAETK